MCYFFIKYMVFDQVRLKPYFIRAERCFGVFLMIFGVVGMAKNIDFSRFCRTRYRSGCWNGNARKCLFYKEFVDGTDVPGFAIEHLF